MKLIEAKKLIIWVIISIGFAASQTHPLFAESAIDSPLAEFAIPPRILLIDPWNNKIPCGVVLTTFAQSQTFNNNYTFLMTLCRKKSIYQEWFKRERLPHAFFSSSFENDIINAYRKHDINVVVTYQWQDLEILKKVARQIPIKVIFYRIATLEEDDLRANFMALYGIHGFIGNAEVVAEIKAANSRLNLCINHFKVITPFWNEKKCVEFSTTETRAEYFSKRFGIDVGDLPICCTLANLVCACKNYPLLLRALSLLIYQKNKKIHAMIAGSGPLRGELISLAKKLQIESYVHFLGSIDDTPALLYHSDLHVLPSFFDSFPLANLEAACMGKPIIVAREISAAALVLDQQTGLHFKTRDSEDLACKISYLLDSPEDRKRMGENASAHVRNVYSNQALYKSWMEILHDIMADKR